MESIVEAIHQRVSVRTYTSQPVEAEKRAALLASLDATRTGPLGNPVRFKLLDFDEMEQGEVKSLGTYGIISGAKLYIVGITRDMPKAMEDLGYCFEKVILKATNLGLGTCWLGGTFKRAGFARKAGLARGEIIPVVSPIGYPHEKRSIRDRALRRFAKSDKRKPWEDICFENDLSTPLSPDRAADHAMPLECVRLAPSASNHQPWRIVKEKDEPVFHFYVKRTRGYDKMVKAVDLQSIDMGIAMCHFELAAGEKGLRGHWVYRKPDFESAGAEYVVTWTPS